MKWNENRYLSTVGHQKERKNSRISQELMVFNKEMINSC